MGRVKTVVGLLLVSAFAHGAGTRTRILIDDKPTRESASRELVHWEAFKLIYGQPSENPAIDIPESLALDSMLRDRLEALERERLGQLAQGKDLRPKGPLTLTQVLKGFREGTPALPQDQIHELISVLRLQSNRDSLTGTLTERARALLLQELSNWAKDPSVAIPLSPALKTALAAEARARAAKAVPAKVLTDTEVTAMLKDPLKVADLATGIPATAFPLVDWMRMGATVRIAARVDRPNTFAADMRAEADDRVAAISLERQRERGVKTPQVPFRSPRPTFAMPSNPSPAPRLSAGGGGFQTPPSYGHLKGSDGGRGGTVSLEQPPPAQISLTAGDRNKLLAERDRGLSSMPLVTFYKRSKPSGCQVTLVGNPAESPTRLPNNKCGYTAMSARHCVEDDLGELFTHAEIGPFKTPTITRLEVDPSGGDLSMMSFEDECRNDVTIVPLSVTPPREGEGLVVYAAQPLIGQASSNGGTENSLMMNVRDPANGDIGIEHGNSGGLVTNDRGEAVGVIASKLRDKKFHQIGFFASKEALYFANRFLNPNFDELYLSGLRGGAGRSPASVNHDGVVQ